MEEGDYSQKYLQCILFRDSVQMQTHTSQLAQEVLHLQLLLICITPENQKLQLLIALKVLLQSFLTGS